MICRTGQPLPDKVISAYCGKYGSHYVMPIVLGKEITGIAFFPLNISTFNDGSSEITTETPIVVEKKSINNDLTSRLFLETDGFRSWIEKGLQFDLDLTPLEKLIETNHLNGHSVKTKASEFLESSFAWSIYVTGASVVYPVHIEDAAKEAASYLPNYKGIYVNSTSFRQGNIYLVLNYPYDPFICCELDPYTAFFEDVFYSCISDYGYVTTLCRLFYKCIHLGGPGGGSIDGGGMGGSSIVYPNNITIPTNIPIQLPNMCLTGSMTAVNHIYGGSINEGAYIMDYQRTYQIWIGYNGAAPDVRTVPDFINRHFNTISYTSYRDVIINNGLVFVDTYSDIPNSRHNVVVVGYEGTDKVRILDPQTGQQSTVYANTVGDFYKIVVTGIK